MPRQRVAALEASGAMAPTQQQTYGVRQDKVAWLTAATAPPHIRLALLSGGCSASAGQYSHIVICLPMCLGVERSLGE